LYISRFIFILQQHLSNCLGRADANPAYFSHLDPWLHFDDFSDYKKISASSFAGLVSAGLLRQPTRSSGHG